MSALGHPLEHSKHSKAIRIRVRALYFLDEKFDYQTTLNTASNSNNSFSVYKLIHVFVLLKLRVPTLGPLVLFLCINI